MFIRMGFLALGCCMMACVSFLYPLSAVPLSADLHAVAPVPAHAAVDYLVNLDSRLPTDYVPEDLVYLADHGIRTLKHPKSSEMMMREVVVDDLAALLTTCEEETGQQLYVRSGYRSSGTQAWLFRKLGFAGGSTPAGTSEHQSGLGVDFAVAGGRFLSDADASFSCLTARAADHGFILSYPAGNNYLGGYTVFEPWHWRFVGADTAQLVAATDPADPQAVLGNLSYYRLLAGAEHLIAHK